MLAAGILGRKQQRAATLTPVGVEKNGPLDGPIPGIFPWDYPKEQIAAAIGRIRTELAGVENGLKRVEEAAGLPAPVPISPLPNDQAEAAREEQRLKERAADDLARAQSSFEAGYEAKIAAAQEQVFQTASPLVDEGWACPVHGYKAIVGLVSRKGRKYRACRDCEEFER